MQPAITNRQSAILLLCLALASGMRAATHYVWLGSPAPTPPYSSWATAATNIQAAVDAAADGDAVQITNGTFPISAEIVVTTSITISGLGQFSTAINSDGGHRCFRVAATASGAVIEDLAIQNGGDGGGNGAGVLLQGGGTVRNCRLTGNISTWSGGGAYLDHGGMVSNCFVGQNSARQGGGAYLFGGGTVMACTIWYNHATDHSGGVCCDGGGVVSGGVVLENAASDGGGIGLRSGGGEVESVVISNNTATDNGGGVQCSGSGTLRDCDIVANVASNHGAGVWGNGALLVSNCTVASNVATDNGGGMYVFAGSLDLDSSRILGNISSLGNGGGLALPGDVMWQATNTLVAGNTATYQGGGFWYAATSGRVVFDGMVLSNNTAGASGGGGSFSTFNTVEVRNAQVVDNHATCGGGLTLDTGTFSLDAMHCVRNHAAGLTDGSGGGGIAVFGGTLVLRDCTMQYNDADSDRDGVGNGGGLYAAAGAVPSSVTIEPRTFGSQYWWAYNNAANGGAIYACKGATVTVAAATRTFTCAANSASNGAGICLESGAHLQSYGDFLPEYNYARGDGGGIYVHNASCDLFASNGFSSYFGLNVAEHDGGAAMLDGSMFSAQNAWFTDNASSNMGGAIYMTMSTATVYGVMPVAGTQPPCQIWSITFRLIKSDLVGFQAKWDNIRSQMMLY